MFWKNTAWSWDSAVGRGYYDDDDDKGDDDGGYLLAVDHRKTPEPAETQLKPTKDSKDGTTSTTARLRAFNQNLDSINANHSNQQDSGTSSSQQRRVSSILGLVLPLEQHVLLVSWLRQRGLLPSG